jgi:hypothetical protein
MIKRLFELIASRFNYYSIDTTTIILQDLLHDYCTIDTCLCDDNDSLACMLISDFDDTQNEKLAYALHAELLNISYFENHFSV